MSKSNAASTSKILNEVEKVVKEYVSGKSQDKDQLKDYMFDSSKALYDEVTACKDVEALKSMLEKIDQITDEVDPKMLMIIGFYNRFGKVIDQLHARIKEISNSMSLEDQLAATA